MQIQAKPTAYNGYLFRSKLEAKWAVFFDALRIPYVYEPEAFVCGDGSQYTPDFYLPNSYLRCKEGKGVYLEIKPMGWAGLISSAVFLYSAERPEKPKHTNEKILDHNFEDLKQ